MSTLPEDLVPGKAGFSGSSMEHHPSFPGSQPHCSPASAQLGPCSELPGVSGQQTRDSAEPQLLLDLVPSFQGDPSLQSRTPKQTRGSLFFFFLFF